jgi:hypothetical protein
MRKVSVREEEKKEPHTQTTPGAAAAGLTGPSRGAKAGPQQSASYHYQRDSLSTHELDLKTRRSSLRCLDSEGKES